MRQWRFEASARRALEEVKLTDRWPLKNVDVVDNILDMEFFSDMLPALARGGGSLQFFYEVKADLSKAQVKLLHEAGVRRIRPGIESLNDHVLALMRKGTTALRNIQLLKWAQTRRHREMEYSFYGFPGETREDYTSMLALLPAIQTAAAPSCDRSDTVSTVSAPTTRHRQSWSLERAADGDLQVWVSVRDGIVATRGVCSILTTRLGSDGTCRGRHHLRRRLAAR